MSDISKRADDILSALDLGFSDYFAGENVRELTIGDKLETVEVAVAMHRADEAVSFSLFDSLGSSHPCAEIYALDFPSSLRASFYLLLGGYYRQAILLLRNWLEMRLLSVNYGFVERERVNYEKWKSGEQPAPWGKVLIARLFSRANFRRADKTVQLRRRLETLYSQLSGIAHGAGLEKYDLQRQTDNVPRYNRESVEVWFNFLKQTFGEVTLCLSLAYDHCIFESLSRDEIAVILKNLPPEYTVLVQAALAKRR